jgi:hypothetical protein
MRIGARVVMPGASGCGASIVSNGPHANAARYVGNGFVGAKRQNTPCTPAGATALRRSWLKQPLVSLEEIGPRHDVVEALVEDASLRQDLQQHLRGQ